MNPHLLRRLRRMMRRRYLQLSRPPIQSIPSPAVWGVFITLHDPMNPRFVAFLATLAAALTAVSGADVSGIIDILPDKWAGILTVALPGVAAFVHFLNIFGDIADDGKRNNSFNPTLKVLPVLLWLTYGLLALPLCSCTGMMAGITGQAPEPVAVRREGGEPVNVAKRDLLLAEAGPPATVYGLYDVGQVAALTGKVVDAGK
jgi:hypothetical protein